MVLDLLGELRDLDVARIDTLPPMADAYMAGDDQRTVAWRAMDQTLMHAAQLQRTPLRHQLQDPAIGVSLLAIPHWLASAPAWTAMNEAGLNQDKTLSQWAKRRVTRLHEHFKLALKDANTTNAADEPNIQHRARILAKQMRYGIEAMDSLLPKKRSQRWLEQAIDLQSRIGASRDLVQAGALIARLAVDRELVAFLRGVAVGLIKPL